MLAIQGIRSHEIDWKGAGVTRHQVGMMIGNAVSVPVIGHVLSEGMFAAGLTSQRIPFPACP